MQKTPTRIFPCPSCGQASVISKDNPWRPFCSERCKLIDLGSWAAEEHKIAGEPALDEMDYDESLFTRND